MAGCFAIYVAKCSTIVIFIWQNAMTCNLLYGVAFRHIFCRICNICYIMKQSVARPKINRNPIQSLMRQNFEDKFASKRRTDEATGLGRVPFTSYDYVQHVVIQLSMFWVLR